MKALILVLMAVALSGASCATGPSSNPVGEIQSLTQSICRFVPTVTTVANILAAGNAAVSSVSTIANAICNAVTINPLAEGNVPGYHTPKVAGVTIRGKFVQ